MNINKLMAGAGGFEPPYGGIKIRPDAFSWRNIAAGIQCYLFDLLYVYGT
jgi:hypothetical protein